MSKSSYKTNWKRSGGNSPIHTNNCYMRSVCINVAESSIQAIQMILDISSGILSLREEVSGWHIRSLGTNRWQLVHWRRIQEQNKSKPNGLIWSELDRVHYQSNRSKTKLQGHVMPSIILTMVLCQYLLVIMAQRRPVSQILSSLWVPVLLLPVN